MSIRTDFTGCLAAAALEEHAPIPSVTAPPRNRGFGNIRRRSPDIVRKPFPQKLPHSHTYPILHFPRLPAKLTNLGWLQDCGNISRFGASLDDLDLPAAVPGFCFGMSLPDCGMCDITRPQGGTEYRAPGLVMNGFKATTLDRSRVTTAYWCGLFLILVGLINATPWEGGRITFVQREGFPLEAKFAPLWRPPAPSSGANGPQERWPDQPVVVRILPRTPESPIVCISPDYVTISLFLCAGLMVLSGLAGGWQRRVEPNPRSFLGAVWSLFIGLCVSGAAMIFIAFGSMGFAPGSLLAGTFAAGIPLGLLHNGLQWVTSAKPRRADDLAGQPLERPRIRKALPAVSSRWMVPGSVVLLCALGVAAGWVEWRHPPVSQTYEVRSWWGGVIRGTDYARQGMNPGMVPADPMEIDGMILLIECALVTGAVLAGLSALKRPSAQAAACTASRITGRAAMVLHASVCLLPLAQAGADTISLLNSPVVIIVLAPNLLSFLFVATTSLFTPTREDLPGSEARKYLAHHLTFALLWAVVFLITVSGFDLRNPMGGAVLGMVALWLSAVSAWFLLRIPDTPPSRAPTRP